MGIAGGATLPILLWIPCRPTISRTTKAYFILIPAILLFCSNSTFGHKKKNGNSNTYIISKSSYSIINYSSIHHSLLLFSTYKHLLIIQLSVDIIPYSTHYWFYLYLFIIYICIFYITYN
jgi:hypothetical protein